MATSPSNYSFPFASYDMRSTWLSATLRQVEATGTCSPLMKAQNKVSRRVCRPLISEKTSPLGSVVNRGNRAPSALSLIA